MNQISKYISYNEAVRSQTATRKGIDNTPDAATIKKMEYVGVNVFDKVREHFGIPIIASSFYRAPKLNKAVGGSPTSQHPRGEAIDMQGTKEVSNAMIFNWIKENLEFDQLIWEFGDKHNPAWVHVSLKKFGNRNQVIYLK